MFTRHSTDFAQGSAASAIDGAYLTLHADTLVETASGWRPAKDLRPTDALATLDGGFVALTSLRRALPASSYFIPAKALGNCTDMILPADACIGLDAPLAFTDATTDTLSVPVSAFDGYRGIHSLDAAPTIALGLASEEMIWAQTGLLAHARPLRDPYFHALDFAQTRILMSLYFSTGDCIPVTV